MNISKKIKKLGAGIMASLCALSVIGGSITTGGVTSNAALTTENTAFPTADEVIAEAATLLGAPYGWGYKGYTGVYYQGSYSPLDLDYVRNQGVDCSGLLYYTLTHLGYSTSGFSWNNPVPVDTPHWLTVNDNCTITYNGVTSKIDVEKSAVPYSERPYWECADGSTITPGSMVIADNLNGEDHSWIYIGEFDSRADVISYLKDIGMNESYISTATVGDGSGDGGTHWRIESNAANGCVINNRTDGKSATAMNMYAFRVAQADVEFKITKVLSTDNSVKISGTSPIDGSKAVYGVYADSDCTQKVGEITIGADGTGSIKLPNRQYYVREISAPTGYALSTEVVALNAKTDTEVQEDILSGSITVRKTAEDGAVGDREFTITWTDGGKEHSRSAITSSDGIAVFDGLHVYDFSTNRATTYTVSENDVPVRYVIPSEKSASLDTNEDVEVTFENRLKRGNVSIIKHSDDEDVDIVNLESGAEFEVYLKTAESYDKADENERDYLITDSDGFAQTKELPYGTYTVHQTKTVDDAECVADFDVNIFEDGKNYEYILNDKPFKSYIKITKVDSETGKVIPCEGAGFQIYDGNGELVDLGTDTFYTDSNGCLITPESLGYGEYTLVEVQAPVGYVLDSTPIPFSVNADNASAENAVNIVSVTKADTAQKGRISITKRGEVFSSVEMASSAYDKGGFTQNETTYTPVFEESGLVGAEFEVAAAEDITTSDGTVRAGKGEVVAKLITDENGYAETAPLYLGRYEVREVKAPHGYVLDDEVRNVELTYAGQEIAITDAATLSMSNAHQGVCINIYKYMEQDELFSLGMNGEYKGVLFGFYADEDIQAADGSVIPKDGLITTVTLDEGVGKVMSDKLPFARYYVQEIATDEHYMLSGEKHLVNFEYMGQEMTTVNIDCDLFLNTLKRGSVSGRKVDEDDEPLEKAVFGLFKADETDFTAENAYLTAESDKDGRFRFDSVPYGKYIVKEISAPSGYLLSDRQYPVTISEDGETVELTAENSAVSVAIRKEDIYGKELTGAKMQLIDANGEVVDEWTSDSKEHIVRGLPAGAYTLKEVAAPDGYVIATDISFTVDEYGKVAVGSVEAKAVTDDGVPCITMVDKAEKKPTVTVPPTGDTGRNVLGLILLVSGLCGIAYAAVKYRKLMKEMHELDTGLAALCPDMIEREEND